MELGAVTLYGEVAFVCHEPPGAVVVFRATADDLHTLEDHMDEVPVVEGGEPWTSLPDEEPTNPAAKVLSTPRQTAELRVPADASTDAEGRLATVLAQTSLRSPTEEGRPPVDPIDPPTVDGEPTPRAGSDVQDVTILDDASKFGPSSSGPKGPKDGTGD